jgi:nondiscriminating aspartyl-tRNA synthetase
MKEIDMGIDLDSRIDFAGNENKEITVTGMIQNLRVLAWGAFVIIRTPRYTFQAVIDGSNSPVPMEDLTVEMTVTITGKVNPTKIKDKSLNVRDYELHVTGITVISGPSISPLPVDTTKKELNVALDTNFDMRPLTLRHTSQRAVFKIAATISNQFGAALTELGFTRISTPKIVFSGAEGGANIFKLDYFERTAFLAQSPQFYKQMMVGVFGRVFEAGPVFRAEKHDTSRHLNEYISLDFEMGFIESFYEIIQVETAVLRSILNELESSCANELELLGVTLPKLDKIVTVTIAEVHEIVFETYKKDYRGEKDLEPEEEKLICEYAKENWDTEFVFVTHYPTEKRPFYTMDDKDDPSVTNSFDLLFRGVEITTGGQRLHRYEDYVAKMEKLGMDVSLFESYLQAFKYGMPPHGGLGLGLERLTAQLCGIHNVKEASLFPRDMKRLEP